MSKRAVIGVAGLAVVIIAVVAGMLWARRAAIATYGTPAAQAEWEDWRREAAAQAESGGPVQRKVPRSEEPPALMLMRDHFVPCLGAALTAACGVYGTFILLLFGASSTPPVGQASSLSK
ncbi:MAG: hypothetical protein U0939_20295 [Pirellulales bacterium]